jgi:hypothetical protein
MNSSLMSIISASNDLKPDMPIPISKELSNLWQKARQLVASSIGLGYLVIVSILMLSNSLSIVASDTSLTTTR